MIRRILDSEGVRTAARAFGDVYTGYMVRHHLRFLVLTFVVILAAVTAINVSGEIARVWAEGAATGTLTALGRTGLYVFCRVLDNGSQIFGISFLLGLVWAETAHAFGGRLLMVRLVGRTFLQRSTALVILAALAVPVQFAFDNIVRPWAFMTLSREGLGEYGWQYAIDRSPARRWYAFDRAVVQMVLHDSPDPVFEKAVLFYFDRRGDLTSVATAAEIVPPADDRAVWTMRGATRWALGDAGGEGFGLPEAGIGSKSGTSEVPLGFAISRLWLEYREIEAKYVPFIDLWRLTRDRDLPANRPKYGAWLTIRIAGAFGPGLVGLFVGAVFAFLLDRKGLIHAAGGGLLAAYCGYFLTRLSALAVENAPLPLPITAAMLPMALAAALWWLVRALRRAETLP